MAQGKTGDSYQGIASAMPRGRKISVGFSRCLPRHTQRLEPILRWLLWHA
jgi:hypothetical protein